MKRSDMKSSCSAVSAAVVLFFGVVAIAAGQTTPQGQPAPPGNAQPNKPEPPGSGSSTAPRTGQPDSLSNKLSHSHGIVQPPSTGDQGVVITPPNPGSQSMPIVRPPGTSGGDQEVQPK